MKTHNRKLQILPPDDAPFTLPPPSPSLQQLYPNPPFDSAMAITVLILLTALFFLGFFSIYLRRFASAAEANPPSYRRWTRQTALPPPPGRSYPRNGYKGVDPEVISSLPVYSYYRGDAKQRVEECSICLGEFEEKEAVKMIPYCRHVFHVVCIDTWLKNHVTCPVCRGTRLLGETKAVGCVSGGDTCAAGGEVGPTGGVRRSRSLSRVGSGTVVALPRSPSW